MPGASEIEENKIFKDIVQGSAGKGPNAGTRDFKKWWDSPLWANLEKKKKEKEKENDDTVNK